MTSTRTFRAWHRPSATTERPRPHESRPTRAAWHVVGTRPDGTRVILASWHQRRGAVRDARTLAAGGIEYSTLTVERDGGGVVLRLAPRGEG